MRTFISGITLLLACLPLASIADDTAQANPCLDCHETDLAQFEATVHGTTECLDCHVGADVTVETLRCAMYRGFELRQVGFVAIEAGVCLCGIVSYRGERQAGKEEGDARNERTHSDTHCYRMFGLRDASTYYGPETPISQHPTYARNTDSRAIAT